METCSVIITGSAVSYRTGGTKAIICIGILRRSAVILASSLTDLVVGSETLGDTYLGLKQPLDAVSLVA